jgi:hypothetical protein
MTKSFSERCQVDAWFTHAREPLIVDSRCRFVSLIDPPLQAIRATSQSISRRIDFLIAGSDAAIVTPINETLSAHRT